LAVSGIPETEPLLIDLLSRRTCSNTGHHKDEGGKENTAHFLAFI
jgi:hypothetical protein